MYQKDLIDVCMSTSDGFVFDRSGKLIGFTESNVNGDTFVVNDRGDTVGVEIKDTFNNPGIHAIDFSIGDVGNYGNDDW